MVRPLIFLIGVFVLPAAASPCLAQDARRPTRWIWAGDEVPPNRAVTFRKAFRCDAPVIAAIARSATQSASLEIYLDGNRVAACQPYDAPLRLDLTDRLFRGDHELKVVAQGCDGPSAFFLHLEVRDADGAGRVVTDSDWVTGHTLTGGTARGHAVDLGRVDERLLIPESRRVAISEWEDYEQWKRATGSESKIDTATFSVAPGFQIQQIHTATANEGSWVSMVTDAEGRLIIGREGRGLIRLTLSADGQRVIRSEVIDDTLLECRGLAFLGKDLYANANNSKGLYRLRSLGGGTFAAPELIFASSGGVGHGRNDLAVGPDGMLYSIHGDAVDLPDQASDYTSPFRAANRGEKTSEGHLLRIDPDKHHVEIIASGLRNPYGIDFNARGDLLTYDADAEHDMGSSWYRPTRVTSLKLGADYGWRGVTKRWPPHFPDHATLDRPGIDIGKGSPTAVKFGTRSDFPAPYREALFALDWAYGRVIAVHCLPRGNDYLMSAETFLQGRPLNVTDIDFAGDGSMWLITGGRKTQSTLYRVKYVGDRNRPATQPPTPHQQARRDFDDRARATRSQLESLIGQPIAAGQERLDLARQHLANDDPAIAAAATHLLERIPLESWAPLALSEDDLTRALRLLHSLSRTPEALSHENLASETRAPESRYRLPIAQRLLQLPFESGSRDDKLIAIATAANCLRTQQGRLPENISKSLYQKLESLYPDDQFAVNRPLSELLSHSDSVTFAKKTMRVLVDSAEPAEHFHGLFVLRDVRYGWTVPLRRSYFMALRRADQLTGGAGMSDFLTRIREAASQSLSQGEDSSITAAEQQKLLALLDRPSSDALPLAEQIGGGDLAAADSASNDRPLIRQWGVEELLLALEQAGEGDALRGRSVFVGAQCSRCHRLGRLGEPRGPDLTSASRRFGRRDLVTHVVRPSLVVAENYRSLQVVTDDGQVYVGQVVPGTDYRSPDLLLTTDSLSAGKIVRLPKRSIVARKESDVSWMPTGLLDRWTAEEIADLLAFIESAGTGEPIPRRPQKRVLPE